MSDIRLILNEHNVFDLAIEKGDLAGDEGLETAVLISLFTNARVETENLPPFTTNRMGWWGDTTSDVPGDKIGSRLWTLIRSKRTIDVLRKAEDYVREALQWLIDDGVAERVTAEAENADELGVGYWTLFVTITRPSGTSTRYQVLWDKQKLRMA